MNSTLTYNLEEQTILEMEIRTLLADLGTGKVEGVAYDTAWVARLAPHYPEHGFDHALEWLRRNQYEDGTWGAPLIHYHDRFISTLAAIVALREAGDGRRDERRVKRGEDVLWKLVGRLGRDDSDTVGFPILSAALAEEATALGLDVPRPPVRFAERYQKKVDAFLQGTKRQWKSTPLSFSLEALRHKLEPNDKVLERNNSVSISPSATAGYLLTQPNKEALLYLQNIVETETGAIPALSPIDLFEIAWVLNHLRVAGIVQPNDPHIRRVLDHLWNFWSQDVGTSYSSFFNVADMDDSAACFSVLSWGGYPTDPGIFSYYENEDHFWCYHGETNPALSAHVRLLSALRFCKSHPDYEKWVQKTIQALWKMDDNGSFWWDKWHASPYYVNCTAMIELKGIDDSLAHSRYRWIIKTQNDDGGWGYLGESTPEETAYCLEALLQWHCDVQMVEQSVLDNAALYLRQHITDQHFKPLWIGKSLYTPHNPVKAVIFGALYRYMTL